MSATRYCDDRLWLEGKDEVCRAFIEAMPTEEREKWDRLLVLSETQLSPPREGWVYLVGLRGRRLVQIPFIESYLNEPQTFAPLLAKRLGQSEVAM